MGTSQSKLSSRPLQELSVEDVSKHVTNLGVKYQKYGDAIAENAVDGEVLASIQDQEEMKATMECLEITNFLHQKVLLKEWNRAKEATSTTSKTTKLERGETVSSITDASEITLDTALSTAIGSGSVANYARRLPSEEEETPEQEEPRQPQQEQPVRRMPRTPGAPPAVPCTISVEHQRAIEPLQLPKSPELLPPDSDELEPFRQLAKQVLRDLHGSIAETNILDISHFENRKGMNNLATAFPPEVQATLPAKMRCHFDQPNDLEICRRFVLGQNEEYYEEFIPREVAIANGLQECGRYYGQVIKLGNLRVGTICSIVEERNWANTTDAYRKASLGFLASVMEQQLERRQVLLQRNQNLREDIEQLKNSGVDQVLAPPFGPIKAVLASQVSARETLFPYPGAGMGQDNGHPTSSAFTRRSAHLPAWHFTQQASEAERAHLHPNSLEADTLFHGVEMDRTPIGKHDLERVAQASAMQILQIDPLSPEAQTIQSLLGMSGTLLGADICFVTVLDHEYRYLSFPTFPKGVADISEKAKSFLSDCHELVQRHPQTGHPFCYRAPRKGSICNYSVMTPNHQAFVVHDVARDQSLRAYQQVADFGFYSGAPIVLRGHAVGVLCCVCAEPQPHFGRAHEVQQEQLAQLVAQQFDTWFLKREMQKLERERRMLSSRPPAVPAPAPAAAPVPSSEPDMHVLAKLRSNRPEDYAALIYTNIQGAAAIQEALDPQALDQTLALHNRVLRTKIAENGGYEVTVGEASAFAIAFTDVVDAVKFALAAQEAMHEAPWSSELLGLPDACEDPSRSFRGLRIRMAIHCGDVDQSVSQATGQVVYAGETLHVAKSLEAMSHGGQILVTADVWNIASHLIESSLGAPQVLDLGTHVIPNRSSRMQDGVTTKNLLQLVPKSLAHNYLESRRLLVDKESIFSSQGRVFPTIKTKKSVGASFHHAPHNGNKVAMLAVDTTDMATLPSTDSRMLLVALSNRINTILNEGCHSGYQCQDFLLAFDEVTDAVRFGLALQENLCKEDVLSVSLQGRVRVGVQEGFFETMGPNPTNGRAEYFGTIVDRVTLIANAASPGNVYLGKESTGMDEFDLLPVTNGFMLDFGGRWSFENVEEEFILYKCHPCKTWYDQMLDNRRSNLSRPWRG